MSLSLTLNVTIPLDSLEILKSVDIEHLHLPWIDDDGAADAVKDVCRCVVRSLAATPYEVVDKKGEAENTGLEANCAAEIASSQDEADEEGEDSDEISEDNWVVYPVSTSTATNPSHEEADDQETVEIEQKSVVADSDRHTPDLTKRLEIVRSRKSNNGESYVVTEEIDDNLKEELLEIWSAPPDFPTYNGFNSHTVPLSQKATPDEYITIIFRDLMNHSLILKATPTATLSGLAACYEDRMDRRADSLSFEVPNGGRYSLLDPQMKMAIRELGLRDESVVLVAPKGAVEALDAKGTYGLEFESCSRVVDW